MESEAGVGTILRVSLPQVEEGGRKCAVDGNANASSGSVHATVLLIEDEPIVRKVTQALLNQLGYDVLVAEDGVEGVDLFREHKDRIRLVLSDLDLPRLDGWGVLSAVRRIEPGIPVILASGYNEIVGTPGSDVAQMPPILHKPYELASLRWALETTLTDRAI